VLGIVALSAKEKDADLLPEPAIREEIEIIRQVQEIKNEIEIGESPTAHFFKEMSHSLTEITGVALSPLLGLTVVGAYRFFHVPPERRDDLPWFCQPYFWAFASFLLGLCALKDVGGIVLPTLLKKPLDILELLENKISGLVAAGAFVPILAWHLAEARGTPWVAHPVTHFMGGWSPPGLDWSALGTGLLYPVALGVFGVVWLVSHAVNVLIVMSPFGIVDAALKGLRLVLLLLLAVVSHFAPVAGFLITLGVVGFCCYVSGWAFRLIVFGSIFAYDFVWYRSRNWVPVESITRAFTGRHFQKLPIRTMGQLALLEDKEVVFCHRPYLFGPEQQVPVPAEVLHTGRGLFHPTAVALEGDRVREILIFPPRFQNHELKLAQIYGFRSLRDVGLRRALSWLKEMCGFQTQAVESAPIQRRVGFPW
jgi:hypothetical protein